LERKHILVKDIVRYFESKFNLEKVSLIFSCNHELKNKYLPAPIVSKAGGNRALGYNLSVNVAALDESRIKLLIMKLVECHQVSRGDLVIELEERNSVMNGEAFYPRKWKKTSYTKAFSKYMGEVKAQWEKDKSYNEALQKTNSNFPWVKEQESQVEALYQEFVESLDEENLNRMKVLLEEEQKVVEEYYELMSSFGFYNEFFETYKNTLERGLEEHEEFFSANVEAKDRINMIIKNLPNLLTKNFKIQSRCAEDIAFLEHSPEGDLLKLREIKRPSVLSRHIKEGFFGHLSMPIGMRL